MKIHFCAVLLTLSTPLAVNSAEISPKIAWWTTLDQARTEAKRTGKPIFLLSAAPHCKNISGMW